MYSIIARKNAELAAVEEERTARLYRISQRRNHILTDRLFAKLMVMQWLGDRDRHVDFPRGLEWFLYSAPVACLGGHLSRRRHQRCPGAASLAAAGEGGHPPCHRSGADSNLGAPDPSHRRSL